MIFLSTGGPAGIAVGAIFVINQQIRLMLVQKLLEQTFQWQIENAGAKSFVFSVDHLISM
ncbi:MAG: hypothetical protein V2B19_25965 [Pseudomonadota bacterium]